MRNTKHAAVPDQVTAAKAYFTERELAEYLAVSVKWLQKMRLTGGGIPYVKFGAAVRYSVKAVREFEERSRRSSTSAPAYEE